MNFVEANGLRFGHLEWGEGPLVLAMHGFPDTPHTWDVVGPRLAAEGFHVVAPFLRGYAPTAPHFTKGFEVLAIPGGHFCHREAPDQLIPVLVRHIKSTSSR